MFVTFSSTKTKFLKHKQSVSSSTCNLVTLCLFLFWSLFVLSLTVSCFYDINSHLFIGSHVRGYPHHARHLIFVKCTQKDLFQRGFTAVSRSRSLIMNESWKHALISFVCVVVGLMPLPAGLPPLPNLPNLNLPLPDLSAVSLAGVPPIGTTGK